MPSEGSVTHWIDQLKAGNPTAAQHLWQCYFHRLVGLARQKLRGVPRRAADEEDVALGAFDSFCRGAAAGRFPQLRDRANLWQLLGAITAHKALDLARRERRHKRGGGAVRGETALPEPARSTAEGPALDQVPGREPGPDLAAEVAEECQRLLARLGNAELEAVALWKMEGYTTPEIAAKLGCVPRSVERMLRLIRGIWEKELAS